ncbi:MAG: DUF1015 domain-containing protein [Actinomycetota bacterium]
MSQISPFVGLRYDPSRVGSLDAVTAPPYDVVSDEERIRLAASSPYNIARAMIAEVLPGDDPDAPYARAAAEFATWREHGVVVATEGPAFYPYAMDFAFRGRSRTIRGLICAVELEDWGGSVIPHERTMSEPVEDRLRLTRAVRANLSAIYAVIRGPNEVLGELLDEVVHDPSDADAVDEAGVRHRLWMRPEMPGLPTSLRDETLMIADGHHRYTMALRYRDEMRDAHGPGPWDSVMMLIVDAAAEEPPVLPFHRLLVAGEAPREGERVRDLEELLETVDDTKLVYGTVSLEGGVLVHRVADLSGAPPTVCALHQQVLLDADHELRFTPDALEAESAVRSGAAVGAFLLPATDAARIRAVVDRGERLPQKSTFFWPKPRTGLVMRSLEAD